jgi:hypothetical protein
MALLQLTPLWSRRNPTHCIAPFTAATHPLSALNDPLVHTGHNKHDDGSARAGQALGSAFRAKMVKSAWAGDVRWVRSRAGWTGTPPHSPASPNPDGRFEHTPPATRRPQHDGGIPWSVPAALRVRVCESCPSCVANAVQIHRRLVSSAGGRHSSAWGASPYTHTHRCGSRVISVRHTPPGTHT